MKKPGFMGMMGLMVDYEQAGRFEYVRETMIRQHLEARGISDPAVLKAMRAVHREEFVTGKYLAEAYADRPLPIGLGQTISQPYIVALMTQELRLNRDCDVLELGTGCGYQTAILARLSKRVYTIERLGQLSESAQAVLGRLGIENVEYFVGDGSKGWPEKKTFDRIIITAAVPQVPQPIVEQLKEDGLLVAPVGGDFAQDLICYRKWEGQLQPSMICGCRFVKLIGEYGFDK
ncbi:MAG: protein-L-isoaspartate(D-aspartate) O-methyltransferase [Sedimentisphaerales bacterium]|nr:protein-L-isoaspartate(D-aspartate) O-methyltransferase [Sedimentisphaerales bacterium]